jgi:cyclophilin family peptidyl-prolyl cis-trans isomerase
MAEPLKKHDIAADKVKRLTGCVMETDKGTIKLKLFPEAAPNTVANWHALATSGFYDGLTFHRVIEGFVAQGGCPDGDGTGGPGWRIACETKPIRTSTRPARSPWPMPAATPAARSSSWCWSRSRISTACTPCSVK